MSIPKYDELWVPILDTLSDGGARTGRELEPLLAAKFQLTDEDLGLRYESGSAQVFYDRIGWALSSLLRAGLLDRPRRAVYQINEVGRKLKGDAEALAAYVSERLAERKKLGKSESGSEPSKTRGRTKTAEVSEVTPQEELDQGFQGLRQSICEEIIDTILSKTPKEFENLVLELLQRMGYGGKVKDAGEVTSYGQDGGIDGVIKEDVLGLGRVHIQAKRYARENTVHRPEIQRFVGALAVAQSKKGVFITTSRYSPGAKTYAESLHGNTTVVLIDGEQLAEYIYDYGLGMQVQQTIEIKKLDSEFWDKMQDHE